MLRRLLGETIQLECICEPDLAPVMADPNSMGQVIMNLAVNARDAMPGGGHLQITTRRVHLKPEHVTHQPDARPGSFARLTVADTGCGMDTTILARSFEPFFTTKPPGKGTGLGLSTVYGIVKQHNGWMEAESEPGKGSQFHIYLEMTNQPTEPTVEETPHVLTADGGQKQKNILVVEDEPVLREFVTQVLAAHGYGILQASDGVEALQVARQTGSEIDLLLTDMVMPNGVTGNHLATQLLAERQHLKVLFTSGYSQELMDNAERLVDGHNFLPKPFDVNRLLRTVRTCLDSQSLPLATDDALVAATD
jgi:CheY-like chemotaxis protein